MDGRSSRRVSEAVEAATSPGSERVACVRVGFPGTREASSSPSYRPPGAGTGSPNPRPWTSHLASDGAKPQVLGWYRRAKATKRGGMDGEESACLRVCAGQRVAQEGSSPSGALMESTVSKSGGNASLAVACWLRGGGQGVHREVESEGYEEQYRAVIEGAIP